MKQKKRKFTYTERSVQILLIVGALNAEIPFVLSAFGKEPVSELGIAWITEIVAVILGYMAKAYFGKKQEGIQKIEEDKILDILDEEDNEP